MTNSPHGKMRQQLAMEDDKHQCRSINLKLLSQTSWDRDEHVKQQQARMCEGTLNVHVSSKLNTFANTWVQNFIENSTKITRQMKRLVNDDFTEAQLGHQATAINVGAMQWTDSIGLLKVSSHDFY